MKVGDIVFVKSNDPRVRSLQYKQDKVKSIGRKYFELENHYYEKYLISTLREHKDFGSPNKVYLSEQDLLDEQEELKIISDIKKSFSSYGKLPFTLDQLRRINNILNE